MCVCVCVCVCVQIGTGSVLHTLKQAVHEFFFAVALCAFVREYEEADTEGLRPIA